MNNTAVWATLAAWLVVCAAILFVPNHRYMWPGSFPDWAAGLEWRWVLVPILLGMVAMIAACRRMPDVLPGSQPLDRGTAWVLLALILCVGAWIRVCYFGRPVGLYGSDQAMDILDPLNVLEFSDFRLAYGDREPLYTYLAVPFIALFPNLPLFAVQHLVSAMADLATIWLLYLLGRELGGRRTGLVAAALGAISKPLVMKVLSGFRVVTLSPAVCLAFLFFFRVVHRPTRGRFLLWVASMALGAYTYTSFRAYIPFLSLALLAIVLRRGGWRTGSRGARALAVVTVAAVALVSLGSSGYLGSGTWVQSMMSHWVLVPLLSAAAILCVLSSRPTVHGAGGSLLCEWSAAVLLSLLLMVPILSHPAILERAGAQVLAKAPEAGPTLAASWVFFLEGIGRAAGTLFVGGPDRPDFAIPGDATLDVPALALLALGSAYLLAHPSFKAAFLFLGVLVGAVPGFLSLYPDSGKLFGGLPLLLVLAAWGTGRWLDGMRAAMPGRRAASLPVMLGVLLFLAGAAANHRRIYDDWALNLRLRRPVVHMAVQAEKDWKTHRVFVAAPRAGDVINHQTLQDGKGVRRLHETNLLALRPWESPRDVVVLYAENETGIVERLRAEYPGAVWSEVHRDPGQRPDGLPLVGRVRIPWETLPEAPLDNTSPTRHPPGDMPKRLFMRQRVPGSGWVRTLYEGDCGLARGLIRWEDWVPSLDATRPEPWNNTPLSARFTGRFTVDRPGKVRFRSERSGNYIILKVGGKRVLEIRPRKEDLAGEGWIILDRGVHELEVIVYYRTAKGVPSIQYRIGDAITEQMM